MADTFKGVYSGNNGSLLKIRKGARTALRKPSVRHVPTEPGVIVPRLVVVPPPPPVFCYGAAAIPRSRTK